MVHKNLALIVCLFAVVLQSCTSINNVNDKTTKFIAGTHITKTTKQHYSQTSPSSVLLLKAHSLQTPYKIIGHVKTNRYNLVGIKRTQATINDLMKKYAATLGGNAVIHITQTNKHQIGDVIRFVS